MSREKISAWVCSVQSGFYEFCRTIKIFYTSYVKPVLIFFLPLWAWLLPRYISLYKKMAYKDGVHVATRGAAALATLTTGTVLALYVNLWYIIPSFLTFSYDAISYNAFSYKTEKLYFASPQWIEDETGEADRVLSVFSCKTRHCDSSNSTEYRFRDSFYLSVIHWGTSFEPYDPADVAGILLSELNYCSATAYGRRFKPLDWYPYIYDIECTILPPTESPKEKTITK